MQHSDPPLLLRSVLNRLGRGAKMVAESSLALLHDRLFQVSELVQALRSENVNLQKEIRQLTKDLEELKKANVSKSQLVRRLEHNRLKIQSRVEKVLQNVTTLEERAGR